VTIS